MCSQPERTPYVSVWVALDDVSEENGCLYILPYPSSASPAGERGSAAHERRARAYPPVESLGPGPDVGLPIALDAGDAVVLSSHVLHCSGPNLSDAPRRAWMPQFSRRARPRRCAPAPALVPLIAPLILD